MPPRFALVLLAALAAAPAGAEEIRYGILRHDPALPHVLSLDGEIDRATVRDLRRALRMHEVTVLFLDSPGGGIQAGLDLSRMVRQRGLATVIPPGAECASACAFPFVAGTRRAALGQLGVHQFVSEEGDFPDSPAATEAETQSVTARILATLSDYEVPSTFLVRMFETPNDRMHWFTRAEMESAGLVTGDGFGAELAAWARLAPPAEPEAETEEPGAKAEAPVEAKAAPDLPPAPLPPGVVPGFDCAAAEDAARRMICATPRLTELDHALGKRVVRLRARLSAGESLRLLAEQLAWQAERDGCEADTECLEAAYLDRFDEIGY